MRTIAAHFWTVDWTAAPLQKATNKKTWIRNKPARVLRSMSLTWPKSPHSCSLLATTRSALSTSRRERVWFSVVLATWAHWDNQTCSRRVRCARRGKSISRTSWQSNSELSHLDSIFLVRALETNFISTTRLRMSKPLHSTSIKVPTSFPRPWSSFWSPTAHKICPSAQMISVRRWIRRKNSTAGA